MMLIMSHVPVRRLVALVAAAASLCGRTTVVHAANETSELDSTIRDVIEQHDDLVQFRKSLTAVGLYETLLDNETVELTVFAPVDSAIEDNDIWSRYLNNTDSFRKNLLHTVNNHIVNGSMDADAVFSAESIQSDEDYLVNNPIVKTIEGARITASIQTKNGYLHIVSDVFKPKFFEDPLSDMEAMPELGPDRESDQRLSLVDVVDYLNVRDMYSAWEPNGMTHVACRIRAFNRMPDYFTQTINNAESDSVLYGELMNASFANQTIHNFVEYSIIKKVYDSDRIEHGYEELIMSQNGCAHMWVTKHQDKICFNDACLVIEPPAFSPAGTPSEKRIQIASNGIGYVVDKCVICPGTAMLANYAAEYTMYNMKDFAQYFVSSEWNLRNLSLSIGDGSPVTLLAADNTAFFDVTGIDTTRLSTDMWRPHLHDFLKHMTLQGKYTLMDLKKLTEEKGGAYNITTLANQTIELTIDEERDELMILGGDVRRPDIQGVDGMIHFITAVPLVRSVTHSVYDIGWWLGFVEQPNLIDSVFLRSDMKRLEPLTAIFAPDEEWRNKIIPLERIEPVLENHLFEDLLWCHTLVEIAKDSSKGTIESLNGYTWYVSLNKAGYPCFDTIEDGKKVTQACITECDVLARNGIVHVVDKVILYEKLETKAPSPAPPPSVRPPFDPDAGGIPGPQDRPDPNALSAEFTRPKRLYDWNAFDSRGTTWQYTLAAWFMPFLMLL